MTNVECRMSKAGQISNLERQPAKRRGCTRKEMPKTAARDQRQRLLIETENYHDLKKYFQGDAVLDHGPILSLTISNFFCS